MNRPAHHRCALVAALGAALALASVAAVAPVPAHAATTMAYTVRSGDTLGAIAKRFGTTTSAIAKASGLSDVNHLRVGQVLRIPATTSGTDTATKATSSAPRNVVLSNVVIGRSVQGRVIRAYLVGDPKATRTQMVLGNMHGDEPAVRRTANAIINGPQVKGIKLWVVPTINPDGLARGTRTNAHGVDLNHNFDDHWTRTPTGRYHSGAKPLSEPEAKAFHAFVAKVKPQYLVSLHQPWAAIDDERVKSRTLQKNLSVNLGLPIKWTGRDKDVSHGTMVGHVNASIAPTAAITVEFSPSPSTWFVTTKAPRAIVKSVGGSY